MTPGSHGHAVARTTDVDTERRSHSGTGTGIVSQTLVIFSRPGPSGAAQGSLRDGRAGPGRCPRLLRPTDQSQTHGRGKERNRRPESRDRQGRRRRMYRMRSGSAAEGARRQTLVIFSCPRALGRGPKVAPSRPSGARRRLRCGRLLAANAAGAADAEACRVAPSHWHARTTECGAS